MTERLPALLIVSLGVLGAIIGSFLNVVIVRLPKGQSVVSPRSRCTSCGQAIPAWWNIPILSWLVLRGKCRNCRAPISVRYPIVEALTALLFVAIGQRFGFAPKTIAGCLLVVALVAITFIDLDTWEIPDEIAIPGIAIGAALHGWAFHGPWYGGLLGAALGAGVLWLIRAVFMFVRGVEGLGLGDLNLVALIGAFMGPYALLPSILVGSIAGAVIGTMMLLLRKKPDATDAPSQTPADPTPAPENEREDDWVPPKTAVPYGPFLSLGALLELLFDAELRRLFFLGTRAIAESMAAWISGVDLFRVTAGWV